MKIWTCIFIFISLIVRSQVFTVGNTCCNYNLVNYTLPGPCTYNFYGDFKSGVYSLDIDGDLIPDISVNTYCNWPGSAGSYKRDCLYLTSNNGTECAFTPSNSCIPGDSVIANLQFGAGLSSGLSWVALTPTVNPVSASSPYYPIIFYRWFNAVLAATFTCGIQTNPFYVGFRKILLSNDTIYGWIRMNSNMPGTIVDYAFTCGSYTAAPPTSTFVTVPTVICKGDSLVLNASPSGGIFSGPGINGNKFKSDNLSPGTYTVFYTLPNPAGCTTKSASLTLTVNPTYTPALNITSSAFPSCINQNVILIASGAGTYTWNGSIVSQTLAINPSVTTVYTISGSGPGQCDLKNTITFTQTVDQPTFSVLTASATVCPNTSVQLTSNGASTYSWSTGCSSNTCMVSPSVTTTYAVAATFSPGCVGSQTITQQVAVPNITATASSYTICAGAKANLNVSGAPFYSWSTGSTASFCYDYPLSNTTYSVIGYGYGNCSDTGFVNITVNTSNFILSVTSNDSLICPWDTATINLSGSTGGYIFESVDQSFQVITSLSTVQITPTVTTSYFAYGQPLPGGCLATGTYTQMVAGCVGVHELNQNESKFEVFPNPNSGEFEIKGIKEETIFISDELGRTIRALQLEKANEYSVRINGLENGIYFVGNRYERQKIVVIK